MAEARAVALPSGYEDEFVNAVEEDLHCSICHLPLKEAVQTGKCGHRFCRQCLDEHFRRLELNREPLNCPVDRNILIRDKDIFPDKATERKILSFTIQCPNHGCEWTGALGEKDNHMESCLLLTVSCTNDNCNEMMIRKDLDKHVTIACQWRLVKCCYCNEPHPACQGEEHLDVCKKYPVQCPAACGVEVPREKVIEHTESDCPLITVSCTFAVMGCDVKIPRNQIESHLQSSSSRHLDLACVKLLNTQEEFREKTKELGEKMDSLCRLHDGRISSLEKQLKELKKVNDFLVDKVAAQAKQISAFYIKPPQLSWRINDVEKLLSRAREKSSTILESSPFYSANHGYKLKLYVYPNGDVTNKHNYLSVFLVLMEGEYDSLLPWPFHQRITFILVDQQEGTDEKKNIVMDFITDPSLSSCAKSAGKVVKPSIGFARFVSHKNLKTRRYIVNDSLLLQIEVHPPN